MRKDKFIIKGIMKVTEESRMLCEKEIIANYPSEDECPELEGINLLQREVERNKIIHGYILYNSDVIAFINSYTMCFVDDVEY